ncbi:hypothetical protein BpHYR1_024293 [Brachionus plicatilis]|uniref:Uncharacterized protein n=1 Tax=Brachionus plicatilis TaxID=10195 RepID=A0A3M7QLN6_BRAPC|nr:hypothetical protein BpHYR1_024293 [Brachionus plicatilis]
MIKSKQYSGDTITIFDYILQNIKTIPFLVKFVPFLKPVSKTGLKKKPFDMKRKTTKNVQQNI